ncbi:50S ribosomal protein L44e [Candidatus Woesearchaeota archaeon]|nr:50S ribosomal protein L44e [Candidatus Woesearchaeota archaeon]
MKMPKTVMRYCHKCNKHTEHKVFPVKKKAASSLKYGSKVRARLRGRARGMGNLGRYSKPAVTKWKMTGKKGTKKTDLRYQCSVCSKVSAQRKGFRTKKLEFT